MWKLILCQAVAFWIVGITIESNPVVFSFVSTGYPNMHERVNLRLFTKASNHNCHLQANKSVQRSNDKICESKALSSMAITRREFLPIATTITTGVILTKSTSSFASAEVDRKSGELFSPKSQMLGGGGSDAARGISLPYGQSQSKVISEKKRFTSRENQNIQNLYNTRFITYLARFLLTFDPAAKTWWGEQTSKKKKISLDLSFANFAESVEVGLADYFTGPYGSYASVQAAKAGLMAVNPATSVQTEGSTRNQSDISGFSFFNIFHFNPDTNSNKKSSNDDTSANINTRQRNTIAEGKQGILNLLALLQARYTAKEEKIQLSILFSFISDPLLQPTTQITALLGEADNASIQSIEIISKHNNSDEKVSNKNVGNNVKGSKTRKNRSCELDVNGGYSLTETPKVVISPPPALGKAYQCARAQPIMKATSRILKINVIDGGSGYTSAPTVTIPDIPSATFAQFEAAAILDREGHVDSIIVLDPGFGYNQDVLGKVKISPPSLKRAKGMRTATAEVEFEYQISGINVIDGGNGYVLSGSPDISVLVDPPEQDPDWSLPDTSLPLSKRYTQARVTKIMDSQNHVLTITNSDPIEKLMNKTDRNWSDLIMEVKNNPTKLFPNSFRPELYPSTSSSPSSFPSISSSQTMIYKIPEVMNRNDYLEMSRDNSFSFNRFRSVDPIFGGIGFAPVTKSAMTLSVSEYTRLGLSGAICTVLVRTLLNPLELVKTKIQLKNDAELMNYANNLSKNKNNNNHSSDGTVMTYAHLHHPNEESKQLSTFESKEERQKSNNEMFTSSTLNSTTTSLSTTEETTTLDAIKSIIELRGPSALFQSADVTFLASLVFGSLGFGATELFRRAFTLTFFEGGDGESELILLLAAAVATIITSLAATPFEMMRVRSMGLVDPKPWNAVLQDFLKDNRLKKTNLVLSDSHPNNIKQIRNETSLSWRDIEWSDLPPLYAGFVPVVSRELPFAIAKFLAFDIVAKLLVAFLNAQSSMTPVQVGVGSVGLAVSAFAGALAGVAGAFVSHPADLILTLTSSASKRKTREDDILVTVDESNLVNNALSQDVKESNGFGDKKENGSPVWQLLVQDLLSKDGGISNLFVGFPARALFFFLVIGLQFFLYDYVKNILSVGSDDLTLVLDVFYAVRQGLVEMDKINLN